MTKCADEEPWNTIVLMNCVNLLPLWFRKESRKSYRIEKTGIVRQKLQVSHSRSHGSNQKPNWETYEPIMFLHCHLCTVPNIINYVEAGIFIIVVKL